jgi:hypothetical protein
MEYEGIDGDNNHYKLVITKASGALSIRAVQPANGDSYTLTITSYVNNVKTTKTSKGTVTVKTEGFELKPNNGAAFTVNIQSELMKGITGTITLENGDTVQAANITPAKTYDVVLTANNWEGDTGQSWYAQTAPLSEYTTHKPVIGQKLVFKVSGTPDKDMNHFTIGIYSNPDSDKWWDYEWYGSSDGIKLSAGVRFDEKFTIDIYRETNTSRYFKIEVANGLWWKGDDGKVHDESGEGLKLPADYKNHETVMATIKDFTISLDSIDYTVTNIYEGFTYDGNDSITITGYRGAGGDITIPSTIGGKPVTVIKEIAFWGANLTSVTIPNSVTSIGQSAFQECSNLASATIGSGVTKIGTWAFGHTKLTSVTFSAGSNIQDDPDNGFAWWVFPEGALTDDPGDSLRGAYLGYDGGAGGAGTYTRAANGSTWTKQ